MRVTYVLLIGALIAASALSSDYVPDHDFRLRNVTFEELFGVSEERAPHVFGKLAACLVQAHQDFNATASGGNPRHATFIEVYESDGGTTHWQGKCYRLTVSRTITHISSGDTCVIGTTFGPSLKLEVPDSFTPVEFARTAFFPEQPCPKR